MGAIVSAVAAVPEAATDVVEHIVGCPAELAGGTVTAGQDQTNNNESQTTRDIQSGAAIAEPVASCVVSSGE